jgi:hypothetical protein
MGGNHLVFLCGRPFFAEVPSLAPAPTGVSPLWSLGRNLRILDFLFLVVKIKYRFFTLIIEPFNNTSADKNHFLKLFEKLRLKRFLSQNLRRK